MRQLFCVFILISTLSGQSLASSSTCIDETISDSLWSQWRNQRNA